MDTPYIFELAESDSLEKIGELTQARARQLQLALNKGGAFSTSLPLVDELSMLVEEVSTCVLIKKDSEIKWSGPVWTTSEATPDTLDITCVGWLQMLEKRFTKPYWTNGLPLSYTQVDAGAIAHDLLTRSNNDSYGPIFIVPGTIESTQFRTRSYPFYTSVLNEIEALTQVESGFDMLVDPATRELDIYQKLGSVKNDIVFEYGLNVSSINRTCDAAKLCNRMTAYSAIGTAIAENPDSITQYGLFEEVVSLSDVIDVSILQAFANAEVAVRSWPLKFHTFKPRPHSSAEDDPRIFEDFNIGDTIFSKGNRGRLDLGKQAVRLFGATISFDDNGQEQITSVQTSAE